MLEEEKLARDTYNYLNDLWSINQFVIEGAINQANTLQIGATIEDLDIVDLQENINTSSNTVIIPVFESL